MGKLGMLAGFLVITALASGCALTETKLQGFADPDFSEASYDHLMIAVQLEALDQRAEAEAIFVEKLGSGNTHCVRALDVIPPTRELDDTAFDNALADAGVDGLLIVRLTNYYEDEVYVPQTTTTNTYGSLNANTYYYGNTASTYGTMNSTSYSTTSGGYALRKPRVRHEVQLWDVESGRMAWIAGAFTRGNSYARFEHLRRGLAGKVGETLKQEGLIRVKGS